MTANRVSYAKLMLLISVGFFVAGHANPAYFGIGALMLVASLVLLALNT